MKNTVICAVLWIATIVAAWLLGSQSTPATSPELVEADPAEMQAEIDRLRALLEQHAPGLEGIGSRPGTGPPTDPTGTASSGSPTGRGNTRPVDDFDPDAVADPNEMLAMLRTYALEMFGRGREGHLQLLATLDQLLKMEALQDRLGRSEEEQWRYLYPMIRFLVQNEAHVVDMMETVYDEMATNPQAFEDLDNNVIEIFADEGIGPMLPAIVDRERLALFRSLAQKILDTPKDRQSKAIRGSRNEIERSLALWWPEVTKAEAFQRLSSGEADPTAVVAYLRKLDANQLGELDLARLLGPAIEAGDRSAVDLLKAIEVDARTVAQLDDFAIRGALAEALRGWVLARYISGTGRAAWADARGFVERGLGAGAKATKAFAEAVRTLDEAPDRDWVIWMLDTFEVPANEASRLKRQYKIPS